MLWALGLSSIHFPKAIVLGMEKGEQLALEDLAGAGQPHVYLGSSGQQTT